MYSTNGIIKLLFALISITNASMIILEFYDVRNPVERRVELYCKKEENKDRNLCKLWRQYNGPCKNSKDKRSCIYKKCKIEGMRSMPICRKFRNISRRSMPFILQIFNPDMT